MRPNSIAVLFVLLLATPWACAPAPAAPAGWIAPAASRDIAAVERHMFERLNRDRAAAGLPPLAWDPRLADVARAHSLDMRDHGFFAHRSPQSGVLEDRLDRAGYLALEMRENLATAADADSAEDNLLESPGHHANIMATSVTHVGVGVARGDPSGNPAGLVFTQVFTRPTHVDRPDQAVVTVRANIQAARQAAGVAPLGEHPLLGRLAARHVLALDDAIPSGALDRVGDAIQVELRQSPGHGIGGLQLVAQALFHGGQFRPTPGMLGPEQHFLAVAAAPARDARGRPRVKLLILLAR